MQANGNFTQHQHIGRQAAHPGSMAGISSIVYRSRAIGELSEASLQGLLPAARARNHAEGVTGLVVYDEGHYVQWLEGPEAGLNRIWNSVRRDARHTDIDVIGHQRAPGRFFGDFDMKLLSGKKARDLPATAGPLAKLLRAAPGQGSRTQLLQLLQSSLIPQLVARHGAQGRKAAADHPQAPEFARLLLAVDTESAQALLAKLRAQTASLEELFAAVFEPAARHLGDLWSSDDCSEFEVTLALGRMQIMARESQPDWAAIDSSQRPVVMVAPQPGETHFLNTVMDAATLRRAGCDVQVEFPESDADLRSLVAATWLDVLDLTLSPSFQREEWLPRMTRTIAAARSASLNPAMLVAVGGRIFFEQPDAVEEVKADLGIASLKHEKDVLFGLLPLPCDSVIASSNGFDGPRFAITDRSTHTH